MNFSTVACYAALTADFSKNIDDAFINMLVGLIASKNYDEFTVRIIEQDFFEAYGFRIPHFPLKRILLKVCKNGYLTYKQDKFIPDFEKIDQNTFPQLYRENEQKYRLFLAALSSFFSDRFNLNLTEDQASEIVDRFIEAHGLSFFQEHELQLNNSATSYRFSQFLTYAQAERPDLYQLLDSIIVGRVLAELVTFSEDSLMQTRSSAKVFIDTGFAFRLLGIDALDRKDIYRDMVKDMQAMGMNVYMFQHTFVEMSTIILNCREWVNNYEFDPSKASEATFYFVNNNYTREMIDDLIQNLKRCLKDVGVTVKSFEYPQKPPVGVPFERDLYDSIVSYYKETNPSFNEEEKRFTVEQDAHSLFLVDCQNYGQIANRLEEVSTIFVTTNQTLGKICRNVCHKKAMFSTGSIPYCVTDYFFGNLIWTSSPSKILEINRRRLDCAILAAFNPSDRMLSKLNSSLTKLEAIGTLDPEQCYALKASRLSYRNLMEITSGDESQLTEATPLEILRRIQEEAKSEGVLEERRKNDILLAARDRENLQRQIEGVDARLELNYEKITTANQQIDLSQRDLNELQKQTKELLTRKNAAERSVNVRVHLTIGLYAMLFIVYIAIGCILSVYQEGRFFNLFSFLTSALAGTYLFFFIAGRKFDIFHWKKAYIKRSLPNAYRKRGFDFKQLEQLQLKMQDQSNTIESCHSNISTLQEGRRVLRETQLDLKRKLESLDAPEKMSGTACGPNTHP